MKKLFGMALLCALFAVGCGKSGGGGGSELEALKKEACACKDMKCAEAMSDKMDAIEEKMKNPSQSDMKIAGEIAECMARAVGMDSK